MPKSAQYLGTTIDVAVGNTNEIEFNADEPGDWAFHCHKTHHTMNGMEHNIPNMIGVDQEKVVDRLKEFFPDYMPMGKKGMGEMFEPEHHHMKRPPNFPPFGSPGPFGPIEMGGMFTVLKVRDDIDDYQDPGWYGKPSDKKGMPSSKEQPKSSGQGHAHH